MTKPELGIKRRCNSCETKFFDLNKDPIVCPKCAAVFAALQPDPVRSRRQPLPAQKVTVSKVPNEFVSIDEPDADKEINSPAAGTEVDGEILLEDDLDEKSDATDIIGADVEKDET